jgi:DNA repair exonuclease SbcCD ATPase subunit
VAENDQGAAANNGAPQAIEQERARAAQLEQRLAQREAELELANTVLEELRPQEELIREVMADPEFYAETRKAREAFKRSQVKEIPEEFKPIAEKLDKVSGYVDKLESQTEQAKKVEETQRRQAAQAWQESAAEFIRKANEKTPGYLTGKKFANGEDELTDDGLMMVNAVATYAQKHQLSFEEAYKRVGDRFAPTRAKTPPPSLPVDAGDIGLPGPKRDQTDDQNLDFATRFERAMGITNA